MNSMQALLQIMQMVARQGNDQLLGEWLRNFVQTLRLVEDSDQKRNENRLLKG